MQKLAGVISEEEYKNRIDLAAAYHLADIYGFSDIIWNHITCKTSSKKNTFLINQFGLRYDEVTASNLLEIDLDGNIISGEGDINYTGFVIHGAIHQNRRDLANRGIKSKPIDKDKFFSTMKYQLFVVLMLLFAFFSLGSIYFGKFIDISRSFLKNVSFFKGKF